MKCVLMAVFVAAVAAAPAAAEEDCRLQIAGSLPLTAEPSGLVSVTAGIGGRPIQLVVDTGAPNTSIRQSLAKELGLDYDMLKRWEKHRLFGGTDIHRVVAVNDFTLGTLKADGISLLLVPDDAPKPWLKDGLLGESVLSLYDVDFDFGHAKMNLFLPHRCPGRVVYWTRDENLLAKVPFRMEGGHIRVHVNVDGRDIEAALDTGSNRTVMDLETYMPAFGLTESSPGLVPIHDSRDPNDRYRYTFKTLTFEGVTVNNPHVVLISQSYSKAPNYRMLIGMDILRDLHLFIAYKEKMLFITSAGAK